MLGFLLSFFAGRDHILCPPDTDGKLHGALASALAAQEIAASKLSHTPDGALSFFVPRRDSARLAAFPRRFGLSLVSRHGLPAFLARYRRRVGVLVGAVLFVCMLVGFCGMLWRVDVQGADYQTEQEIRETLAKIGCDEGAWLGKKDFYAVSTALCAELPTLSYASVVRDGMTLAVTVRLREDAPPATPTTPANLVADRDGVILSLALSAGQPMVSVGQAVRRGELLAGGVVLHRDGSLSVVRAAGTVMAETTCTASAEAATAETKTVVRGRVVYGRSLKIFGKEIKFFKSTGNTDIECDTITEELQWSLGTHCLLPIRTCTTYQQVFGAETITRTDAEAVRLATERAMQALRAELGDAEVLTMRTETEQTETGWRVTCTATCRKNIALTAEIQTQG